MSFLGSFVKKASSWYTTTAKPRISTWYITSARPAMNATPDYLLTDRPPVEPLIGDFNNEAKQAASALNDLRTGKTLTDKLVSAGNFLGHSLLLTMNAYDINTSPTYTNPDSKKTANYELIGRITKSLFNELFKPWHADRVKQKQFNQPMQFVYQP